MTFWTKIWILFCAWLYIFEDEDEDSESEHEDEDEEDLEVGNNFDQEDNNQN